MKLLDAVALVEDVPALKLYRGQVGTKENCLISDK